MKKLRILTIVLLSGLLVSFTTANEPRKELAEKTHFDGISLAVHGEKALLENLDHIMFSDSLILVDPMQDAIVIELDEVVITGGLPAEMKEAVLGAVKYPDFARKQMIEGVVVVGMSFDSNGNLQILESYSNNTDLESYVTGKIAGIQFGDCTVWMEKEYVVRILFRIM